jgi:XTP/dITP diphosphohydrolase
MEIVIASHSVHKIKEFRDMLKQFKHIDVLSLLNFPQYVLPEETGTTFRENAIIKATDAALVLNKWVLADDSGLVVPALNGEPGVYSRRYAGNEATDAENRQKLLLKMANFNDDKRLGIFECCLALASPEGIEKVVSGTREGMIIKEERGRNGFGYDSLFEYQNKTFAELQEKTKNLISHRGKAFEKLIPTFETFV